MVATETQVSTPKVSKRRGKAKQEDLPEMKDHQRRIAEIEDLADKQLDLKDEVDALKEKLKDADEELVASMKRHDKTFYERQTWGRVILKEGRVKATVKKAVVASPDTDDDNVEE